MGPLGVFGSTVADDLEQSFETETLGLYQSFQKSAPRRMGGMGGGARGAPLAEMAMMEGDKMADSAMGGSPAALNASFDKQSNVQNGSSQPEIQAPNLEAAVRENFADTALWVGTLSTDKEGLAEVEFKMPENLTTWKVNVWALGHGTNVGEGHTEVITRKDLIVRLQAPRFFTETDEVMISANVHNYLDAEKLVTTKLIVDGEYLVLSLIHI